MAGVPLPPQFYENAAADASRGPGVWPKVVKTGIVLGALLGAAWGFLNYYWLIRLPLEHSLQSDIGPRQVVRLTGRSGEVIQYEVEGETLYRGIGVFNPLDQAFLRRLPETFELEFPQRYSLPDQTGRLRSVTLESRNEEWLKYTDTETGLTEYVSMLDLPEGDQLALIPMPAELIVGFPLDYTLPGPDGRPLTVRLEGRSNLVVRYTDNKTKVTRLVALASLTPKDQRFIRQLPEGLRIQFPFEWVLTGSDGEPIPATVRGRGKDFAIYTPTDGTGDRFIAYSSLSETDRNILNSITENSVLRTPLEHTLTNAEGATERVRLEGRSDDLVKVIVGTESAPRYRLISELSPRDQALVNLLPSSISLAYPIEAMITNKDGRSINVNITGRDLLTVSFSMPPAPAVTQYAINQLSPTDQAFVRTLPLPPPRAAASASATQIANLEARLVEINKLIGDLQARNAASGTPPSQRQANEARIRRYNDEVTAINRQLDVLRSSGARPAP